MIRRPFTAGLSPPGCGRLPPHMSILESVPRARRFPLDVPVRVRRIGATVWEESQAVNISRSGLLVAFGDSFRCDDTIEAIVELSQATAGVADLRVRGRIARVAKAGSLTQVGTTIDEYRLQQPDAFDRSNATGRDGY
jgi:hypothetical protein